MTKKSIKNSEMDSKPVALIARSRKEKSREKEYRRAQNINGAFENLQQHIPYLRPEERKQLPKIKTLRLAMQYISHLNQLLDGNQMHHSDCDTEVRPLQHSDFRMAVASEMRVRNSYRERAHMQEMDPATVHRILAREEQRSRRFHVEDMQGQSPAPIGHSNFNVYNFRQISANEFNQMQNQAPIPMNPVPQCYFQVSPEQYSLTMENAYSYH